MARKALKTEASITLAQKEKLDVPIEERLDLCRKKIRKLSSSSETEAVVELAVWLINLLSEIYKTGELYESEVTKAYKMFDNVFTLLRTRLDESELNRLFAAYKIASGKLKMNMGQHFAAVCNLEHAFQLDSDSSIGGIGNRQWGEGFRLLRLGFAKAAISRFQSTSQKLTGLGKIKSLMAVAKAQRLSALYLDAKNSLELASTEPDLPKEIGAEIEWEIGCGKMIAKGGCGEILSQVLLGQSLYNADFYTEAMLWVYAFGDEIWLKRFPSIAYQLSRKELDFSRLNFVVKALKLLDECYSKKGDLRSKINDIGELVDGRAQFIGIDREQLFLVACARWLHSVSANRIAALVLAQYRIRSLQLSDQRTPDHLGVSKELQEKSWFKEF
jgi:tetratricopeptide (TPR) repeat protein